LVNSWTKKDSLTHILKAHSGPRGVRILPGQESFNLSAFAEANAFVVMPEMQMQWTSGELVDVYLM
jgi:molybdopterin biosynthesis enzyme